MILALLPLLVGSVAHASIAPAAGTCFNLDSPVTAPLKDPFKAAASGAKRGADAVGDKDQTASGTLPGKGVWGAAHGVVRQNIARVYERLLDHATVKDTGRVKLRTYEQPKPGYADFHLVMVELKPTPLVTLNWEENWAYAVTEGTAEAPRRAVISYQKTNGTRFIPHLCGSIVLSSRPDGATDVLLYEEIDAVGHRSGKETAQGHLGTLATLRK